MTLSGLDVVRIWEAGCGERPVNRALVILGVAFPERAREDLAALSLRERDALLFSVRRELVGSRLDSAADCLNCATPLEFSLDSDELVLDAPDERRDEVYQLAAEGVELRYRLPNSADLALVASADAGSARSLLLEHCILAARRGGEEIRAEQIPEPVLSRLAAELEERDAAAELRIELNCPDCGHHWAVALDIAAFFWTELSAHACRLLREVDTLARTYGWREIDILSMSAPRRQFYLNMVLDL